MSRQLLYTPVRRAHAVAPFGPGALVLTRNRVSAVVCGPVTALRALPQRPDGSVSVLDEQTISDRHLEAACGVRRFVTAWAASDDPHPDRDWFLPAARFPLAEHCANPACQRMVTRIIGDANEGRCEGCAPPGGRGRWPTFQVPLALACPAGHLADVPWEQWLHAQPGLDCARPDVRYRTGSVADRPSLRCQGCKRSVQFAPDTDFACPGERPQLPHAGPERCEERARPIERTSTAMYYPTQMSSLTIPVAGATNPVLLRALQDNPVLRSLQRLPRTPEVVGEIVAACARTGVTTDTADVGEHLIALDKPPADYPSRGEELDALTSAEHIRRATGAPPDLIVEPQEAADYDGCRLGDVLSAVSLVPRLRETRVLAGFSRVEPERIDPQDGYAQMWGVPRPVSFAEHARDDWLPGYEVFGEGILLVLDPELVDRWAAAAQGSARLVRAAAISGKLEEAPRPLPWLMAHTLAHLFMRALAPHAGYPLPSLRERIFAVDGRTALLIYTAAGDVHGTLGGLVELGRPGVLRPILDDVVEAASWCATDPVCSEGALATRGRGTPPGACHHCMLVPETSCELFNKGLDRGLVLGGSGLPGFLA